MPAIAIDYDITVEADWETLDPDCTIASAHNRVPRPTPPCVRNRTCARKPRRCLPRRPMCVTGSGGGDESCLGIALQLACRWSGEMRANGIPTETSCSKDAVGIPIKPTVTVRFRQNPNGCCFAASSPRRQESSRCQIFLRD